MRNIAPSAAVESKASSSTATLPPPTAVSQRTPWHSPVPYLFGGLAAMLGLIAFALLILACSYWKLSAQADDGEREGRDLELGGNGDDGQKAAGAGEGLKVYEEKILVIMAGDQKPTFLATPVCAKISSLGSDGGVPGKFDRNTATDAAESCMKVKEMGSGDEEEAS